MLNMSRDDLAKASQVAERTIADFEAGRRQPIASTLAAMQRALQTAGVEFIAENGGGPGVRLRKSAALTEAFDQRHLALWGKR